MDAPDHYQTTYVSKTKIVVFYSQIHLTLCSDVINTRMVLLHSRVNPHSQSLIYVPVCKYNAYITCLHAYVTWSLDELGMV